MNGMYLISIQILLELRNLPGKMRLADLLAPLPAAFDDISSRMEQWQNRSYLMTGKRRPVVS